MRNTHIRLLLESIGTLHAISPTLLGVDGLIALGLVDYEFIHVTGKIIAGRRLLIEG